MLDLVIPEISATAGEDNDGVVLGRVMKSPLVAAFSNDPFAGEIFAWAKDFGVTNTYRDISTEAVSDIADSCLPWGTDESFSTADELWVAGNTYVCDIYVQITTPGVWDGDGIEILESIDGETLVPVENVVDPTNGLRAAGVYKIHVPHNDNRQKIAPMFGEPKQYYLVVRPKNLTAKTTAPKLSHIWLGCPMSALVWGEFTWMLNAEEDDNDFTMVLPATVLPTIGAKTVYGYPGLTIGTDEMGYRGSVYFDNITSITEYLATDGNWKPLEGVVDTGDYSRNWPMDYTPDVGIPTKSRWPIPADWAFVTQTFPPDTQEYRAYWVRGRITGVTNYVPTQLPLWRSRARAFGSELAHGIWHQSITTYHCAAFTVGVPSTTDVIFAFVNANTGGTRTVTIPAGVVSSGELENGRLEFASPLVIAANEQLLISYVSGGTVKDVQLHLMGGTI